MHVQASAALDQRLHLLAPPSRQWVVAIRRSLYQGNLSLVLAATVRGTRGSHVRLISGLAAPRSTDVGRMTSTFSSIAGARPRPWEAYQQSRAKRCADRVSPGRTRALGRSDEFWHVVLGMSFVAVQASRIPTPRLQGSWWRHAAWTSRSCWSARSQHPPLRLNRSLVATGRLKVRPTAGKTPPVLALAVRRLGCGPPLARARRLPTRASDEPRTVQGRVSFDGRLRRGRR